MRRPIVALTSLLVLGACRTQATIVATPTPTASLAASPVASTAPAPEPTATPTPAPSPSFAPLTPASAAPTAAPSATPVPVPSGSPVPLGEAEHGDDPFPSPPPGAAIDLDDAVATAGAGQVSAHGAIDGEIYTEWAARAGVGSATWLAIDLGKARKVSKVDLLADGSPEADVFFNVEVSADGATWRTVAAGKALASKDAPTWGTAAFSGETTRWVRVVPTSWGTSWVAVWEVRLRE